MLNRDFHSNVNVLGKFYKHFLTDRHCLISFWNQSWNKNICKLNKGNSLKDLFVNLSVQRPFLQYKSQCLKKVDVKYVIKRRHDIFHIIPQHIPALQLRCQAWYGSLGLILEPTWKMSCNNLLILMLTV